MSSPKISALLSQHWRHSALCVTVWAAAGEQFLWMKTVNIQGKVLNWPWALRALPSQASELTQDSNLSESSGREQCVAPAFGTRGCYASRSLLAVCRKTTLEIVVRSLDSPSKGDSTRLVGYCGHPWQELGHRPIKWIFQRRQHRTHTHGEVWPAVWKCGLSKHWT